MTGRHTLVVRLDSLGDMVVCGPAVRAVAARSDRVTVLAGPRGAQVAALLPGVDDVMVFTSPWTVTDPPPVDPAAVEGLVAAVAAAGVDEALILTSYHQSALPTALLLRLAGVARVAAVSEDYPGSLLDVRIPDPPDGPEPVRMAAIAAAAGFPLPPGDDGALRLTRPPAATSAVAGAYVVLHPGADAPSRALPTDLAARIGAALTAAGHRVVVTGSAGEAAADATVAAVADALDLTGRLDVPALVDLLAGADALVCGNTGPGHLAAAVGTPVVSLFAPVVPARRWAPHGPHVVVLGDGDAPCRGTRARVCPVPGHPCVSDVAPADVVAAVERVRTARAPLAGVAR